MTGIRWVKSWTVASRPAKDRACWYRSGLICPLFGLLCRDHPTWDGCFRISASARIIQAGPLAGVMVAAGRTADAASSSAILLASLQLAPHLLYLLDPNSDHPMISGISDGKDTGLSAFTGITLTFTAPAPAAAPRDPRYFSLVLDPMRLGPVLPFSFFRTGGIRSVPSLLGHVIALHDLTPLALWMLLLMAGPAQAYQLPFLAVPDA